MVCSDIAKSNVESIFSTNATDVSTEAYATVCWCLVEFMLDIGRLQMFGEQNVVGHRSRVLLEQDDPGSNREGWYAKLHRSDHECFCSTRRFGERMTICCEHQGLTFGVEGFMGVALKSLGVQPTGMQCCVNRTCKRESFPPAMLLRWMS